MQTPDWKKADLALVREAVTDGTAKLQAQLQIATSADQRASVLAGIYIAASTGIIGVIATSVKPSLHLFVGASVTAGAFMIGALLCILTMLPIKFWTAGNEPDQWYKDINNNTPLCEALGEQAEFLTEKLQENNGAVDRNARRFLWGALIGAFAPVIGTVGAGITSLFL